MNTNNLLKDWLRYKARKLEPKFDVESWFRVLPSNQAELEKDLVGAIADGIYYGNWPWVKIPPDLIE